MLPTFNMTGKNVTPERQMAMMRTYLNELKDNTESELYDIKWENLSKPLREKIDSLDRYQVQNDEMMNYLSANMATISYLQANYIKASDITAEYITGKLIAADTSHFINTTVKNKFNAAIADVGYITASYITADNIWSNALSTKIANAGYITAGYITADHISGAFVTGNTSVFSRINIGAMPKTNSDSPLRIKASGNTYANVYRVATATPNVYYLAVNYPD